MKPVLLLLGSLVLLVLVFLSGVIITANVIAEPEPHRFANIDTPDLWTSKPKEIDPAKQTYQRLPDAPLPQSASAETSRPAAPSSPSAPSATPAIPHTTDPALDHVVTASVAPSTPAPAALPQPEYQPPAVDDVSQPVQSQHAGVDATQAQFCYARYRSYRVEDNSYQPFDGGPRRQCQAPGAPQAEAAAPLPDVQKAASNSLDPINRDVASAPVIASRPRADNGQKKLAPLPPEAIPTDSEWHAIESGNQEPQVMESAAPAGDAGSHEQWCAGRYQSYRSDDNSYQPFDGSPRRACRSPFG